VAPAFASQAQETFWIYVPFLPRPSFYALISSEFPRIPYTGSPVSEKTSSRQLVNRGNLPSSMLEAQALHRCARLHSVQRWRWATRNRR
jgi:hypothetical protein